MSRLPVVSFRTLDKALRKVGFRAVQQKGSHVFYRHEDGRTTTGPNHPGRDISRPLLRAILRDIEMSTDDFIAIAK